MDIKENYINTLLKIRHKIPDEAFRKLIFNFSDMISIDIDSKFNEIHNLRKMIDEECVGYDPEMLESAVRYIETNLEKEGKIDLTQTSSNIKKTIEHFNKDLELQTKFEKIVDSFKTTKINDSVCDCVNIYDICLKNDIRKILSCRNYQRFITINPIFELIFEDKKVEFTKRPQIISGKDFNEIIFNFAAINSLYKFYNDNETLRIIIGSSMFDYSMRNIFNLRMKTKETIIDVFHIRALMTNDRAMNFFRKNNFDPKIWENTFEQSIKKCNHIDLIED